MKRRSTLVILALVFVVLIVWTMIANNRPAAIPVANPTSAVLQNRVYSGLTASYVTAVRIRSTESGVTLAIARDPNGAWQLVEGTGTLSQEVGEALAITMVVLPYLDTLSPDDDLSVYGFIPEGILALEMVLIDGSTSAVAIGYRTPSELGYYAFIDERPDMYILDRAPIDYLISVLRSMPTA